MLLGKAEVSQQGASAAHEDVGQFQIAVQEVPLSHLDKPADDVLGQLEHLGLSEFAALLEQPAEVALVAVLSDDVAVGGLAHHIVAPQDVGVFEAGQRLDLAI